MEEFGFLQKVAHNFWPQLMIVAVLYIVVILAIFFDLLAGIRKAKQRGEFRSSFGFRKTIDQILQYVARCHSYRRDTDIGRSAT